MDFFVYWVLHPSSISIQVDRDTSHLRTGDDWLSWRPSSSQSIDRSTSIQAMPHASPSPRRFGRPQHARCLLRFGLSHTHTPPTSTGVAAGPGDGSRMMSTTLRRALVLSAALVRPRAKGLDWTYTRQPAPSTHTTPHYNPTTTSPNPRHRPSSPPRARPPPRPASSAGRRRGPGRGGAGSRGRCF